VGQVFALQGERGCPAAGQTDRYRGRDRHRWTLPPRSVQEWGKGAPLRALLARPGRPDSDPDGASAQPGGTRYVCNLLS